MLNCTQLYLACQEAYLNRLGAPNSTLLNWQINQRSKNTEANRNHPYQIISASAIIQKAAQIGATKTPQLMGKEN